MFSILAYVIHSNCCLVGFSEDVSVPPGTSVVLNCSFTLPTIVDNSLLRVEWSFNGSVIASYNHTQPGFFLNTSAAFTGSFPLTVYNTTPNEQGVYECSMNYNDTDYSTDVTLTILGGSQVSSLEICASRCSKLFFVIYSTLTYYAKSVADEFNPSLWSHYFLSLNCTVWQNKDHKIKGCLHSIKAAYFSCNF